MLSIRVHLCLSLEVLLGLAAVFEPANAHPWGSTGTYPTGSAHPYPHPQNFTRRVTRTRMRVKKIVPYPYPPGNSHPTGNPYPIAYPKIT
jgi:hypothetical protein